MNRYKQDFETHVFEVSIGPKGTQILDTTVQCVLRSPFIG